MSGALGIAQDYRDTWRGCGSGGQAVLLGTLVFVTRAVGFSFLLPLYAKSSGFSTEEYGLLFALQSTTPIIALLPILFLARRGWDRRLMMLGPGLAALGVSMLVLGRDAPLYYWMIAALLCGGCSASYWTLSDPLLAEATPAALRPRAYALKWLFFTVGSSSGALVAGGVPDVLQRWAGFTERNGYWAMLFGFIALDLAQVFVFRRAPNRALGRSATGAVESSAPLRIVGGSLLLFALVEATQGIGYNTIRPFISLFLTERQGLSSGGAGLVLASTAVFAAIGALLMPVMAQQVGNSWSLAILRLGGAAAIVGWFVVGELSAVIALTLLYYGLVDGTSALYAAEVMGKLPAAARDLMAGLNNVMWSIVAASSAALSGFLQDLPAGGFGLAFSVGIAGYVISALLCAYLLPRIAVRRLPAVV